MIGGWTGLDLFHIHWVWYKLSNPLQLYTHICKQASPSFFFSSPWHIYIYIGMAHYQIPLDGSFPCCCCWLWWWRCWCCCCYWLWRDGGGGWWCWVWGCWWSLPPLPLLIVLNVMLLFIPVADFLMALALALQTASLDVDLFRPTWESKRHRTGLRTS